MTVLVPLLPWYGEQYDIATDEVVRGWHLWCVRVTVWRAHAALHIVVHRGSKRYHPSRRF